MLLLMLGVKLNHVSKKGHWYAPWLDLKNNKESHLFSSAVAPVAIRVGDFKQIIRLIDKECLI